jgi:ABC-type molybdate transport system substrate-binding protein
MKMPSLARWSSRLGFAAILVAGTASAADVHVMISAGFYGVYAELGPQFEKATGHHLVTVRGPSMGLAAKSIAYSDSGSGTYLSRTLFPKLGVADQIAGKSRKVRGPPSGEPVAAVVARGEAEIGFQQVSELIHVAGVTFVGPIPAELQPGFSFAGAITATAKQPDAAAALLRFLSSPEAAPTIQKAGLAPIAGR